MCKVLIAWCSNHQILRGEKSHNMTSESPKRWRLVRWNGTTTNMIRCYTSPLTFSEIIEFSVTSQSRLCLGEKILLSDSFLSHKWVSEWRVCSANHPRLYIVWYKPVINPRGSSAAQDEHRTSPQVRSALLICTNSIENVQVTLTYKNTYCFPNGWGQ